MGLSLTRPGVRVARRERKAPARARLFGYVLIAPLLVWLLATIAAPLAYSVYLSFTDAGTIGTPFEFIGLDNYSNVLGEPEFWSAFLRSIAWAIGGALLQTIMAFAAALVLHQAFRGRRFARTWIVLSWIVPTIVIAILWRWMLNASFGVVNYVLTETGLAGEPVDFLGDPSLALPTVVFVNAWRWFPFLALIILAGLAAIPRELYDAARVDGASSLQIFRSITLPLLQPVMYVVGLLGTLWSFNVFDVIWLLTQGGPSNATETLPVLVYQRAFDGFAMGEASTISVLLALFLLVFALAYMRFVPHGENREVF